MKYSEIKNELNLATDIEMVRNGNSTQVIIDIVRGEYKGLSFNALIETNSEYANEITILEEEEIYNPCI